MADVKQDAEQKKRGEEIKYVVLELLMKNAGVTAKIAADQRDSIEFGMLQGIQTEEETNTKPSESFILIRCDEKVLKACNMHMYNVLTYEVYNGTERAITFFRADEEDQKLARDIIANTLADLKAAGRMTANDNIVDVSSYSEVPSNFGETAGSQINPSTTSITTPKTPTTVDYTAKPYKSKEKEPLAFKRTDKKPTKALLEKMRIAVQTITDGTYEAPALPVIAKDDDPDDDPEDDSTLKTSTLATDTAADIYDELDDLRGAFAGG